MSNTAMQVMADRNAPINKRIDGVRALMEQHRDRLAAAAAGLLTPERLISVTCNSMRKNPELLECEPRSLFGAIQEAASYGWVCDGQLGHASLVPFNNRSKGVKEVVLIPGYKGLRDLIRRSGQCLVTMESVHEGDTYEYLGRWEMPRHQFGTASDRRFRPVTHAYVVGQFNDGRVLSFSWTVGEVLAHRDRYSQSWKRVANSAAAKDSPWNQENPSFRVMAMKTVLLDAIHRGEFPMSVEDQAMARREPSIAAVESTTVAAAPSGALTFVVEEEELPVVDLADVKLRLAACDSLLAAKAIYEDCEEAVRGTDGEFELDEAYQAAQERIRAGRGERSNK